MKLGKNQYARTGLCRVCGNPTKMLIHEKCGKSVDAERDKVAEGDKLSESQKQKKRNAKAKKAYQSGKVPKFCFY